MSLTHRREPAPAEPAGPSLGAVVPAHQAAREIDACLGGLLRAGFAADEILVVDDGSRDGTGERARAFGARVIRNERAEGPAEARNRGVAAVEADVVVFVDADVVLHAGGRDRIAAAFEGRPDLSALFGSYDDAPPAPGVVGRYRNLLHHYVHQRSRADASTFWTGIGAVRRSEFLRLGGLDKAWQNIEDVEFGLRLKRAGGAIALDRRLLGTHLKAWTTASMFRTDLRGRAIPWTRLLLFHGAPNDDLNLTGAHRASALMVALFAAGLVGAALDPRLAIICAAAAGGFALANRGFLAFLARAQGPGFAAAALPFHALHYLAALLGYAWVLATEGPSRVFTRRRAEAP